MMLFLRGKVSGLMMDMDFTQITRQAVDVEK
jgi:hypothetical protein